MNFRPIVFCIILTTAMMVCSTSYAEPNSESQAMAKAKLDAASKPNFDQRQSCKLVKEAWELVKSIDSNEVKTRAKQGMAKCQKFLEKHPKALSDFEFNGVEWGMSKSKVKSTLKKKGWNWRKDVSNSQSLGFVGKIDNKQFVAVVYFVDDNAAEIRIIYAQNHSTKNVFFKVYDRLAELLKSKYGEPKAEDTVVSNDLYIDEPENYGLAVSIGHMSAYSEFYTGLESNARLAIYGSDYKVTVALMYQGPLREKLEQADKKDAASAL